MSRNAKDSRFEELYRSYYKSIVGFLKRLGFPHERARDLAQDTFVRVYRSMDSYRGDAEWGFLVTTARNVALNAIRDGEAIKRKTVEMSLDTLPHVTDSLSQSTWTGEPLASPEKELIDHQERTQQRARLEAAIRELPEGHRRCLLLWLSGCKYQEIEKALNLTGDAVKSRLYDTRKRLRERLGEEPGGVDWPAGPTEGDHDR